MPNLTKPHSIVTGDNDTARNRLAIALNQGVVSKPLELGTRLELA